MIPQNQNKMKQLIPKILTCTFMTFTFIISWSIIVDSNYNYDNIYGNDNNTK